MKETNREFVSKYLYFSTLDQSFNILIPLFVAVYQTAKYAERNTNVPRNHSEYFPGHSATGSRKVVTFMWVHVDNKKCLGKLLITRRYREHIRASE